MPPSQPLNGNTPTETTPNTMSTPSPKCQQNKAATGAARPGAAVCPAHTRDPWKKDGRGGGHRHDWWPVGARGWAMWLLVGVVAGVLVTALVFAVDAGLRSAGVMSYAGAGGGPAGYNNAQGGGAAMVVAATEEGVGVGGVLG
ncbi:hypothetical protein NKR19_g3418 [Coniochaeta hoffmannii]|uniref:Uncharacterized protein n=1 Tax=Coniochaeta hoffmannii TaxID=91930 RepID=A0AA38S3T3_9PEZI|nr:hypothetical protein NKR19_g3418 [Coniochaeta hoffmannii]